MSTKKNNKTSFANISNSISDLLSISHNHIQCTPISNDPFAPQYKMQYNFIKNWYEYNPKLPKFSKTVIELQKLNKYVIVTGIV